MPAMDVMLMLAYYKEKSRNPNEIDLADVDPQQFAKALGVT